MEGPARHQVKHAAEGAAPAGSHCVPELREAVARLRLLTEGSSDHLLLLDSSLRILFVNRAVAGRSPEQLTGCAVADILPERGRERALACMRSVLQHGVADRFEVEWQTGRGVTRFMEARVAAVREKGQIVGLTLNASDTTEHVLAQRAVTTQAKMIESMIEGVALLNPAGTIVITNPAFDTLFGYERGLLIGRSLDAVGGGEALAEGLRSVTGGELQSWPCEFDTQRVDGALLTVSGALSRLDDGGGAHLLPVLKDVSERKLLESAILEAVNREQYRIGNDLHDGLGQELTGIALMLRYLAGRLATEHRTVLPELETITQLVSSAVESTRSLARGLSPVNLERGGLRDALEGLAMSARSLYGIKAVFTHRLQPAMKLDVEVANHLYRIAQEAVTNAVKHGAAKSVRLTLSAQQRRVKLTVVDDGCGIADSGAHSHGMGLRIMRYRARMARGDVRIERAEPRGTRVTCECSIDSPLAPSRRATQRAHGRQSQRAAAHRPVAAKRAGNATPPSPRHRVKS